MSRVSLITAAFAVALASTSCSMPKSSTTQKREALTALSTEPLADDHLLVTVNGQDISRGDYVKRVLNKAGKYSLQRQIIDDELIRQEAERLGIVATQADVAEAARLFLEGIVQQRGGPEAFEKSLAVIGMSVDEFRSDLIPQVRSELLRVRVVQASRQLTEAGLREAYSKTYRKKRYMACHIAYSFQVKPGETENDRERRRLEAFTKAKRAAERVRGGHDFSEIARAESDDQITSRRGGELPVITEDDPMPPEFKEAIFGLTKGQVSEPVANPGADAYHIFTLKDVIPSESFVDCADKLRKELLESEPAPEELAAALARLRAQAKIQWAGPEETVDADKTAN